MKKLHRNEDSETGKRIWAAVDRAASRAPQKVKDRMNDPNHKDTNPKDGTAAIEGRVPMGLFPDTAIVAGNMSMLEGMLKYGRYNYRIAGIRASVYHSALLRHLTAWWNGEDLDPQSGLPHTWKALACLAILIDAESVGKVTDDRPPRAPVNRMLDALKPIVRDMERRLAEYEPYQYDIGDSEVTERKLRDAEPGDYLYDVLMQEIEVAGNTRLHEDDLDEPGTNAAAEAEEWF